MYVLRLHDSLITQPIALAIPKTPVTNPWPAIIYSYSLRFSLHLTLISLFETLFFWSFISKSEDAALINLIDNYATGLLSKCTNLTINQQTVLKEIIDTFINQNAVDTAGIDALNERTAINNVLIRNSWIYVGALLTLFTTLSTVGHLKRYKTEWSLLIGENVALVVLLGLYEWMYFSTIVLQYQAISMPELDKMVMDKFQDQC